MQTENSKQTYYAAVMAEFGMHETCIAWRPFTVSSGEKPWEKAVKVYDHYLDMVVGVLPEFLYKEMVQKAEPLFPVLHKS